MPFVQSPPEHVAVEVQTRKVEEEKPAVEPGKLVIIEFQPLVQNDCCLLDILLIREDPFGQRLCVFRHTLRVEQPHVFGQLACVPFRRADRQRRAYRVDVCRRNVPYEIERTCGTAPGMGKKTGQAAFHSSNNLGRAIYFREFAFTSHLDIIHALFRHGVASSDGFMEEDGGREVLYEGDASRQKGK